MDRTRRVLRRLPLLNALPALEETLLTVFLARAEFLPAAEATPVIPPLRTDLTVRLALP